MLTRPIHVLLHKYYYKQTLSEQNLMQIKILKNKQKKHKSRDSVIFHRTKVTLNNIRHMDFFRKTNSEKLNPTQNSHNQILQIKSMLI